MNGKMNCVESRDGKKGKFGNGSMLYRKRLAESLFKLLDEHLVTDDEWRQLFALVGRICHRGGRMAVRLRRRRLLSCVLMDAVLYAGECRKEVGR